MAKSTSSKTTKAKTTTRKSTAPKAVAEQTKAETTPAPEPVVVTTAAADETLGELKKTELLNKVIEVSGVAKRDAKPVVEAMLAELGDCVAKGRSFNLQPFGKLRINRVENKSNGRVVVNRLRQSLRPDAK
jgi:DNA-binding protein HU-alpha